ncbi:von Willebrand factor A domain-containing protein 7-like [Seriola lalandi dorsalis]|uniref:von Willebrand factor A domain-containing protein 7-like n=1 Tax=Seriola lalandi dorsalis TaxID=1841481 RepID=UPI000C6F58F4|nr:von Willebrand factor A domain-containing protein 7-like [Seriola lalandi dorsalis]XP_023277910.1 von Willebrand factor A domain-containing protein 7-like [Seriola lalandi dorsalis]XP_023277911.1 von Willebrand factor A domain-containing protein 7-like [Seriola lalandi dorsalis]
MTSVLGIALLGWALMAGHTVAFVPIGGGVSTHVSITGTALLDKVKETCRAVAEAAGHEFNPTGSSPEELVQACLGPTAKGQVSGAKFHSALQEIYNQNGLVDRDFVNSDPHHFNSEAFLQGRGLITEGMVAIKANIRKDNFQAARETLGRVLHTLQDFYSHSNWVELGNTEPYINLIRPDRPLENLADVNTATCRDCASGTCPNSILPNILNEKKLTSGYMGIYSSTKPKGKCSHGGAADLTSTTVPRGGINKDERRSDNVAFHNAAVNAATAASLQLLEDIRLAAGDNDFLRMMGIARSSVVCFVIDTTGSMSDDIDEAREVVYEIIDSKKGTQDEPSEYILVPFNDPSFGPMIRTTDPDKMKKEISKLKAQGGGDIPELCLSGLQLALTGAPASSHIFVFTDATAKDIALKDTIVALIRSTKSTVSFFMTTASRRRRRSLGAGSFEDYKDLAVASGGQAIQVSKRQLPQATDVILDTSTSALVTVLQRARNPGKQETFPFVLDESLQNITIYITGTSITFTLTNPAGVSQSNTEASGKLGTVQTVGNLRRIRLNAEKQTGRWQINIKSNQPYTLKVTGQSTITFIYNFVESFKGPHPGFAVLSGRPQAGQPATLMLSVMGRKGPSSMSVGNIGLVTVSGPEAVSNGTMTDMGGGDILVTVDMVPEGEFVVILKGTDKVSNSEFQRQSTTQMSVSKVNIQAAVDSSVEPGEAFKLPFSVMTQGSGGQYHISARNDRNFPMSHSSSLTLTTGKYTNDTLTITAPVSTPSGTDVTLTVEAKSSSGVDSNYVVLRLSVVTKITDFVQPLCEVVSVQADDCPQDVSQCGPFKWELSANLTDGNGTGIERISLQQGNGSLSYTSLSAPVVQANYNASCCSQIVEFIAVDKVGNVGKCYQSIVRSDGPPALTLSLPLWLCLLVSAFVIRP